MEQASAKVATKLAEAMRKTSHIAKVSKQGISYSFQAWDDVLPAVREAILEVGLVIVPSMGQSEIGEYRKNESANAQSVHNVPLTFLVIDTDSGECIEAEWSGESRDVSDKGKQKAGTSGMKYWLLKLFMIPDKESSDLDEQSTNGAASQPIGDGGALRAKMQELGIDKPLYERIKHECKAKGEDANELIALSHHDSGKELLDDIKKMRAAD